MLLVLAMAGGCSHERVPPGSTISDGGALVDFRSMPTRTQVGMGPDGFVSYPTGVGAAPVPTTLVLPGGTVHRDFFEIDIGTSYAFAPDPDERHQPTDFDFYLRVSGIAQARTILREDAAAFGLSAAEVADVTAQGTSVEQGFVQGWLSTVLQSRDAGDGDGSLNLIYTVSIGRYHDEAVDKVLHGGRMDLDLTRRPTPADLGFRDSYDTADVTPEPGHQLGVTLEAPAGSTTLPTDALLSQRADGVVTSTVLLGSTDLSTAPGVARSASKALGFDVAPALRLIRSAGGTLQRREVPCASTDVYTCAVRVETFTQGEPARGFGYRITLTYR